MFNFYTPWKLKKTFGFLTFSGVKKRITGLRIIATIYWRVWVFSANSYIAIF